MRSFKLALSSLALLLALCTPALAQSPSASQYEGDIGITASQSLGDGASAIADNTGQGTDAVNDALNQPASASASASPEGVASESAASENEAGGDDAEGTAPGEGLGLITKLPETGGVHPALLVAGALLLATGLIGLRMVPR